MDKVEQRTKEYKKKYIEHGKCVNDIVSELPKGNKSYRGKVRDMYFLEKEVLLIATDRQSAFDRQLAEIPFKGQVLSLISKWWFDKTKHIVENHFISMLDPSVMVVKQCKVFPIEFVVRGYITGSTNTSMWTHYEKGCRDYCGNVLEDGWKKHQKLPTNMVTPTTKDAVHDELISGKDIVEKEYMSVEDWEYCCGKAKELFAFGQKVAGEKGLILVDTKYEFGKNEDGTIMVIDEMHTPDSSRYWLKDTYEECMEKGETPKSIDKEFLRLWFKDNCDPYEDTELPVAPKELVVELSRRYIMLYELITSMPFEFPDTTQEPKNRILNSIQQYTCK